MLKPGLLGFPEFSGIRQTCMAPARRGNSQLPWIAGWALAALILIGGAGSAALNQAFSEPDNAMRLVRVRDMLAGQGWFDSVQHRLGAADGMPMHWAQWIDAAIAAPILLLAPLIGQNAAEIVMAFVWPLGLLAVFMLLVVRVSGEIGARDNLRREAEWAGAIVGALAFPAIEKFSPGSFDHHNVELILGMLAVLGLMKMRDHPRSGLWAGVALGLAVATAAEGMPLLVAGMMIAGVLWLLNPDQFAKGLAWLGTGVAAASVVMFAALTAPSDWLRPVCDAMGAPFMGLGLVAGGVAVALAYLPAAATSTLVGRFISAGVLGAAGIVLLAVLFPECAGGSYSALNLDTENIWISQVSEARSLAALWGDDPTMILTVAGASFAGLIAGAFYLRAHWRGLEGWVVLAFLLASWAVLVWQIRGATFATAFAIPFGAWAVAKARRDYRSKASAVRALVFAGVAASSAAAAWASAGEVLQSRLTPQATMVSFNARTKSAKSCAQPDAFKPLAGVAPGTMLNQFSLGSNVLVWTQHRVLAAPYHRNIANVMTMMNALRSTPDDARSVVLGSVADYVLVCPDAPETRFYARHGINGAAPDATLSAMLGEGRHPDWLVPVELAGSPLKLYRVIR